MEARAFLRQVPFLCLCLSLRPQSSMYFSARALILNPLLPPVRKQVDPGSQLVEGGISDANGSNTGTTIGPGEVRYLPPEEIQTRAAQLFETMHDFFDKYHNKRFSTDYEFADTTLGGPLLDVGSDTRLGGDVNKEVYWDHSADIDKIKSEADRSWWGTLVAAVLDEWKLDVHHVHTTANRALRYIEFNDEVRAVGHEALFRDSFPITAEETERARARFNMASPLPNNDPIGIDFFVSHNWLDENAPQRWNAMLSMSDLFQKRYGRLPRFWWVKHAVDNRTLLRLPPF
jgi:hypothetical protein